MIMAVFKRMNFVLLITVHRTRCAHCARRHLSEAHHGANSDRFPTVFATEFGLFLDAQGTHLTIDAVAFLATASSASEASGKVI